MKKIPFRFRYFLSHLLISFIIAGISMFLIFGVWYPSPLYQILGVGELVMMMIVIDVILGPLLTLMLVKEGKKGMMIDLTIIGLVQLSALCYGLYSVDKGRPMALAFDINRFEIVTKNQIQNHAHQQLIRQYATEQGVSIPAITIRPAKDDVEYATRMQNELEKNQLSIANPELYESLAQNINVIKQTMKPISELSQFNKQTDVAPILARYPDADGFLPLAGRTQTATVLINSHRQQVVAVVALRPW